jgi:hypothetical protein
MNSRNEAHSGPMRRLIGPIAIALASVAIVPAAAQAQASIAGVVRDSSGAVLPGVTVEAASPALIEKVRTAVTGGTGQYRIENLRPGAYSVTFTLPGFNSVKRDGIELTGSFTATVNADLRVGAVEETITVTGETPVVDVQNTTQQRVLSGDALDAIPVNRVPAFMAALIPGVSNSTQDVGGSTGPIVAGGSLSIHGSRPTDIRTMSNGVSIQTAETGSSVQGVPNIAAFQEVVIDTGAADASNSLGGVRINLVPKEGGNAFHGSFVGAFANEDLQSSNFTDQLRSRGLSAPTGIRKIWDVNPSIGGPIRQDILWFHATIRHTVSQNYDGALPNLNAGHPNAWTYLADASHPSFRDNRWKNGDARLTWQATPKNKIGFAYDQTYGCQCPNDSSATIAPEAAMSAKYDPQRNLTLDWTSPVTNRLLFDAVAFHKAERAARQPENLDKLNPVTEQSTNLQYRGVTPAVLNNWSGNLTYRFSLAYVTGAHAFKAGFNNQHAVRDVLNYSVDSPVSYRFNNGVPNQVTLVATPFRGQANLDADFGVFAQDRWTLGRVTLSGGMRFDYFATSFPEQAAGPTPLTPSRNITFPDTKGVSWKDITPRTGFAYDVSGNGKTAVKASLNKYLAGQALRGSAAGGTVIFGNDLIPTSRLVTSVARSWNDANRNFVPDCDLIDQAANGECGAGNPAFGSVRPGSSYDPDILAGWGNRAYNWELSAGVQQEVLPRVSADVSVFRRWYGNFAVTDNRAVAPEDFTAFSITAPAESRLPGGGGYPVSGLYNVVPAKFNLTDNYITFARNYGRQIEHWNGVDVTVNARPGESILLQGGVSTGKATTDNCEIVEKLPEMLSGQTTLAIMNAAAVLVPKQFCHQESPFLTQVKFIGAYVVPVVDVQISGAYQSIPGPQVAANLVATSAQIAPALGRSLSGNAANATIAILEPGAIYGERLNQLDLRVAKILRFGQTRSTIGIDIANALNANPVMTESVAFATWRRPLSILMARFVKLSLQFDF